MAECIKCKAILPPKALFCPACGKKQTQAQRKYRKRSHGTGSIYKIPGNRSKPWGAKRNGIYIGAWPTRKEAQKALERLTDATITDKFNMTFTQVYEAWKPIHAREVTQGQMNCYTAAYKHCSDLYDKQFRKLRKSDFQMVIIKLEQSGKSKSSCEKVLQLFGQLSKWALDEEIIQANHAQNVQTVAKQLGARKPFTVAQIQAIQKSKREGAKIALIMIATGCRPNELFKVPLSMCYKDYFISGSKTEAGMDRVIPVAPLGLPAYNELIAEARKNGGTKLIDGYKGNHDAANFRKRDFKALMEEIGAKDMTPYNCRHTFTTMAAKSGISPQLLRRMLGHASVVTTDKIYTHLDGAELVEASKSFKVS